ncbi:MAG: hypothetical protein ABSF81_06310 [Bacteroidales bacterium]
MSFLLNKIIQFIIGGLMCLVPAERLYFIMVEELHQGNFTQQKSDAGSTKGYRDIIFCYGKFLAVGNDGKIDYINSSGERAQVANAYKNTLNCVISSDQIVVAAGDNGIILFSSDRQVFTKVESGTDKNINGMAFRNDLLIAGADKGTILISKNGKTWNSRHLEIRGNIVSVSANDSYWIGITDKGEIIRSYDGLNWEIKDYNKEYSGYNKACIFKKVLLTNNWIVIIGSHNDGLPAVLFSSLGNVWTERLLIYHDDQGIIRSLTNKPNGITYDPAGDQFILACDNGVLFSLPSCTKCNTLSTVSDKDLNAIICTEDFLISVGEGFSVNIIKH